MKFCIISVIVRLLLAMAAGGLIGLALGAGFYEGAFIATAFSKLLWLNDGAPES